MFAFVLVAALLVASASATSYSQCSSGPAPLALRVDGCDASPCTIKHGQTVRAEVDFAATKNVAHLKPEVKATVFGITVPYPLPEKNACNSLINSACPLESGDVGTYVLSMPISSIIPSIDNVQVQLSLIDSDTNAVQSCFKISLSVK